MTNNAAAWSSGAVGDGYHYLDTGTDALVIRTNGGQVSANFLGNAGGVPSEEGKALFYKGVQVYGDLVVGGVNVEDTLALKADQGTTYSKTEVDTSLALKADQATTYSKTEVDTSLALKADAATTYSKTEVDTSLALKADLATTYNKTEVDASLALKANQGTTYNKTEVDASLAL